jgi:ubiquinone/menaquinone biosynthesis C-methylase UbiE
MNNQVSNNLSEYSNSYRSLANIYEEFSSAEDYPEKLLPCLIPHIRGKVVADIGCGNGKYLNLFSTYCYSMIGLDKSFEQVNLAKDKCSEELNVSVIQADATEIPLVEHSVDVVLACWMLGTILERDRQEQVIKEMKRICKPGGKIIFIENMPRSEFEALRGRFPDPLNRTEEYNNFLMEQGFELWSSINTHFEFSSIEKAREVFKTIWKDRLVGEINSNIIKHKIGIFCYSN